MVRCGKGLIFLQIFEYILVFLPLGDVINIRPQIQIQTPLGALTIQNCHCNSIERIYEDDVTGDTDVSLLCNLDEPNGDVSNITGINYVTSRLEP